jgi:hypothetical protein
MELDEQCKHLRLRTMEGSFGSCSPCLEKLNLHPVRRLPSSDGSFSVTGSDEVLEKNVLVPLSQDLGEEGVWLSLVAELSARPFSRALGEDIAQALCFNT